MSVLETELRSLDEIVKAAGEEAVAKMMPELQRKMAASRAAV